MVIFHNIVVIFDQIGHCKSKNSHFVFQKVIFRDKMLIFALKLAIFGHEMAVFVKERQFLN